MPPKREINCEISSSLAIERKRRIFIISPLPTFNFSVSIPDVTEIVFESESDEILEQAENVMGEKVKLMISEKFSVRIELVEVSLRHDFDKNIICLERIRVAVNDGSVLLELEEYLKGEFSTDVIVEASDTG